MADQLSPLGDPNRWTPRSTMSNTADLIEKFDDLLFALETCRDAVWSKDKEKGFEAATIFFDAVHRAFRAFHRIHGQDVSYLGTIEEPHHFETLRRSGASRVGVARKNSPSPRAGEPDTLMHQPMAPNQVFHARRSSRCVLGPLREHRR